LLLIDKVIDIYTWIVIASAIMELAGGVSA